MPSIFAVYLRCILGIERKKHNTGKHEVKRCILFYKTRNMYSNSRYLVASNWMEYIQSIEAHNLIILHNTALRKDILHKSEPSRKQLNKKQQKRQKKLIFISNIIILKQKSHLPLAGSIQAQNAHDILQQLLACCWYFEAEIFAHLEKFCIHLKKGNYG